MKLKIESSGWDNDVLCPDDPEEEMRRKQDFIDRNEQEYGIHLDINAIAKNEGMRFVAKLIANCFWVCVLSQYFYAHSDSGRWSLQNNLTQDCITTSPYELHIILENNRLEMDALKCLLKNFRCSI